MLCDEWVTTIRLEHHYPETRHKHKQNTTKTTTNKQTEQHDRQTDTAPVGRSLPQMAEALYATGEGSAMPWISA